MNTISTTCRTSLVASVSLLVSFATLLAQPEPARNLPVKDRSEIKITKMPFNGTYDDFAPVIIRGGRSMIFTSARPGPYSSSGEQSLFVSENQGGRQWGDAQPISQGLARAEHVGAAALTPDGNFMIFAAYDWDAANDDQNGSGRTDLYSAVRVGGAWGEVQNLGPVVNSDGWDSQPSLSPDGRLLFFASDRKGGFGGTDIYVSRLTAAGWSAPVNLGSQINTAFNEMAPTFSPDGKVLFFSSNGLGGVGGYDLFAAHGGNQMGMNWKDVENMGTPINSTGDEYFWVSVPNSTDGYFSSDRGGDQDIYLAVPNPFPPEALVTVTGHVADAVSRHPIAASITVTDLTTGEAIANYRTDDLTGDYYVMLPRGRHYSITAEAPNYIFYSDEYEVPKDTKGEELTKDIFLQPTSGGTTRLLVYFDYDKADLQDESLPDLRRAVQFLKNNPDVTAEVAGHTDSIGNATYNRDLSERRADAVRQYLIDHGVAPSRLKAVGYGELQPVADNGTPEGRARNRRVELRVTGGEKEGGAPGIK